MSQIKKFRIEENIPQIELNGEVFGLPIEDLEFIKKVDKIAEDIEKTQSFYTENTEEAIKEISIFCAEKIDHILGEGASNKIFKDNKASFIMLSKTLALIVRACHEFQQENIDNMKNIKDLASKYQVGE